MVLCLLIFTFLIIYCIFLFLFKSSTPRNFDELLIELHVIWLNIETKIQDLIFGYFYNKVSLHKQPSSIAVLTGGNRGIGIEVLKKLLECKITVILAVRDIESAKSSVESYIDSSLLMNKVIYESCDIGDMASVREFAKRVQKKFDGINLLINNAGMLCSPYKLTSDGFVSQMAVNYIGHFLLSHLLTSHLIAGAKLTGKSSRIVNVASCNHFCGKIKFDDFNYEKAYHAEMVYCDSKLAQVMFTRHLQEVSVKNNWNVQIFSCHPGLVDTGIFKNMNIESLNWLKKIFMKSPEQGSRSVVYAAIAPEIESNGGIYISNCRSSRMSKTAMKNEECQKLFLFTCKILGIENFGQE